MTCPLSVNLRAFPDRLNRICFNLLGSVILFQGYRDQSLVVDQFSSSLLSYEEDRQFLEANPEYSPPQTLVLGHHGSLFLCNQECRLSEIPGILHLYMPA